MKAMRPITSTLVALLPTLALAHPGHREDKDLASALLHVFTPDSEHLGGAVALVVLAAAVLWKVTAAARKKNARSTEASRRSRT